VKELSQEARLILATVLSVGVIAIWSYIYNPPVPPKPPSAPAQSHPSTQTPASPSVSSPAAANPAPGAPSAAPAAEAPAPRAASAETSFVIENDLYRVSLSNRGGVVRSWELKKYNDDKGKTLDLVHPAVSEQLGGWPLSLTLDDPQAESAANSALYEVTPSYSRTVRTPAEVEFAWSDGKTAVTKRLKFSSDYVVNIETSVLVDGKPVPHGIAWRGGFGDSTAFHAADLVRIVFHQDGKLNELEVKKLGVPDNQNQRLRQIGSADYAGIVDHYFAAIFLPPDSAPVLTLQHWKLDREYQAAGKTVTEPVAEVAAGSTAAPEASGLRFRLFVGPKDLDDLARIRPPLTDLVQFGWLAVIAKPLLFLLKWIHGYVPNWGWSIALMTILINVILFPLKMQSWRSMQKMQKVGPEIRQIQDRYKKYSMRDPRKQEMQQEVMAVYKREGINPAGGCLPMVFQMPIWFALYRMLGVVIELRQAPWIGWIRDLSAPDPFYILPVLMGVTMYVMQKMTPVTTTDPAQQRMMTMMPLMFGGMFVIFPVASGLVLYILTSNLVNMAQQAFLNRSGPGGNDSGKNGKNSKKK
jgi:YidC/Oxa1 family membrane protein insertase